MRHWQGGTVLPALKDPLRLSILRTTDRAPLILYTRKSTYQQLHPAISETLNILFDNNNSR